MNEKLKKITVLILALIISLNASFAFAEDADEIAEDEVLNSDGTLKTETEIEDLKVDTFEENSEASEIQPESIVIPGKEEKNIGYSDAENKKIKLLTSLDIPAGSENPDATVTRGEFAEYITSLLKLSPGSEKTTYFYDVDAKNEYLTSINAVCAMGLMNGVSEKMFYPENPVSYIDALVVLVRALDYEVMAKNNGGYPDGYRYTANRLKLYGQGQKSDGMLTERALVNLFYEALFCCVLDDESYSRESVTYVTDNMMLLEKVFGYKEFGGRMVADGFASVGGRKVCDKGSVVIELDGVDYVYRLKNAQSEDYLGKSIYYYADSEGEIICMRETGHDKELILDANYILESDTYIRKISWYDERTKKSGTERIEDTADFIYNGINDVLNKEDIEDANGTVRLTDTDGNGVYDCVFVTNYQYYLVDGITSDGILRDKRTAVSFDFHSDEDEYYTTVIKYGIKTEISMINPFEIVAVAKSRNSEGDVKIVAYVYDDVLEGTVTSKGDEKIGINGKEYSYVKGVTQDTLYLDDRAMFGLDENGRICLFKKTYNNSRTYLYVTGFHSKTSISTKCTVRGMNDGGDFAEYDFAEKFKVNGKKGDADDVRAYLGTNTFVPQLAAIELDEEGKIREIQFSPTPEGARPDGVRDSFIFNKSFTDARLESSHGIIAAEYWIIDSTRVFTIYTDSRGEIIEDASSTATKNYKAIASRVKVPVDVYDACESDRIAGAAVFKFNIDSLDAYYNHDPQAFVVDKVFYKLKDDGEYTVAASGYQSGSAVTLIPEEDVYDMSGWKKGDVYRITKGINGNIINAVRVFGLEEDPEDKTAMFLDRTYTTAAISTEKVNATSILMLGNLRNVDNDVVPAVYIEVEGTGEVYTYKLQETSRIYKYDTVNERYSVITAQDLTGGTHKAFVFARYGLVRDIVVIE